MQFHDIILKVVPQMELSQTRSGGVPLLSSLLVGKVAQLSCSVVLLASCVLVAIVACVVLVRDCTEWITSEPVGYCGGVRSCSK